LSLFNLGTIGGKLIIEDNDALVSLAGISGVSTVGEPFYGGDLIIRGKELLVSLDGLEN
jgi:hypothetical protein